MDARWLVPAWSKSLKAHLCVALGGTGFVRLACGVHRRWKEYRAEGPGHRKRRPWVSMARDDGRPRCGRCLGIERKARQG